MSIVFCKKNKKVNEKGKWQKHRIVSNGILCDTISPDPQMFSAEKPTDAFPIWILILEYLDAEIAEIVSGGAKQRIWILIFPFF